MRIHNISLRLFSCSFLAIIFCALFFGCSGTKARVMHRDEANMVGSNKAGSEVYNPIVHSTVDKLIGRVASTGVQTVAYSSLLPSGVQPLNVYFAGIENRSMEELGDFKEHLKASINERLARTDQIAIVSDRAVDAILRVLDLRADDLLIQDNMRNFASAMGENRSPVDYILFAQITSGTTESNRDMQREYKLTLKLIDTKKWTEFVESSQIRKEYNNSPKGKFFNWFKK